MKGKTFLAVITTVLALAMTILPGAHLAMAANLAAQTGSDPVLVGHLTWEGRPAQPNDLQKLQVVLTIKDTKIHLTLTTGSDGQLTASLAGLDKGTYTWHVKGSPEGKDGPGFLARSGKFEYRGDDVTKVEMGTMKAGDADNDNVVDMVDVGIMRFAYGSHPGDERYDARADFDGDEVIGINDFNLIRSNFGRAGDF